jgi:hypothetical protein
MINYVKINWNYIIIHFIMEGKNPTPVHESRKRVLSISDPKFEELH